MSTTSYDFGFGYEQGTGFGCQAKPSPCLVIEVDGVTFTGAAPVGAGYGITAWDGWDSGGDAVGGPQPYLAADGGYETSVYFGPRTITLEGRIVARSQRELAEMTAQLSRVCVVNRWATMVVSESKLGMQRQMRVCRLHRPKITPDADRRTATFTLELQSAAFPKLDATESSATFTAGESKPCVNAGDYPAALVGVFTGPLTNPTMTVGSDVWTYVGSVPAGEKMTVDFSTRMVRDNENLLSLRLNAGGNWPRLDGTETVTLGGAGSGSLLLKWRSSWV